MILANYYVGTIVFFVSTISSKLTSQDLYTERTKLLLYNIIVDLFLIVKLHNIM